MGSFIKISLANMNTNSQLVICRFAHIYYMNNFILYMLAMSRVRFEFAFLS